MQINCFQAEAQIDENRLDEQIHELGLKVNVGEEYTLDRKQINLLLNHILSYPSTSKAYLHRDANRLGQLDIDRQQKYRRISEQQLNNQVQFSKICSCCGFILQQKQLQVCNHNFIDIQNLGISTFVYFRTIINVAILLAIMFVIYSLYSIISNIKASQMKIDGNTSSQVLKFLSISLGSKQLFSSNQKRHLYAIGAGIGCLMLAIWGFTIIGLKYYQKQDQIKILNSIKTVSQCSLVIEKMPTGMTLEQVQVQFNRYLDMLKEGEDIKIEQINVEKYNEGKPFYFNQEEFNSKDLKLIMQRNTKFKNVFMSWILQRRYRDSFSENEQERRDKYQQYNRLIIRKNNICERIIERIKQQYKKKNKQSKTTVFITFTTNRQKNLILDYNPQDIISRMKDFIPCFKNKNRFFIERNGIQYNLKIYPAPDPQDIVWSNIGVTTCQKVTRKILTYSITFIVLAISFVIVYSLSKTQAQNQGNFYLSILISLTISIVNIIIIQVIQLLTKYERDYTMTNYQTSLAIKSIVAQVLNTICIPFLAAYFIKKNMFGPNGLVEDVFILSITNSFVTPLFKLIDPYYYLRLIYSKYKLQPSQKLQSHQPEINQICERLEFQVGYQYIYIINLFIFTCFYVSLQPIIPIFSILGLLLMYWAQKFSLFQRCQRPVPGTKILNTTMSQLIYFGTISFSLGSLTWSNFLTTETFEQSLIPNLISASLAFLIFIMPYEAIFRKIFKQKRMPQVNYKINRLYYTSEYDRLNPSTAESGIKQYRQFLQTKRKQLEEVKPEIKNRLSIELQLNNRPNFFKQTSNGLFNTLKKDSNQAILNNLIHRQAQNILTPQMIANVIMPNKLSLSRTNFRKMPIINLQRMRSTIPRRSGLNDIQLNSKPQIVSKDNLVDVSRIQSINIEKVKENTEENIESKGQTYFKEISQANSYIIKLQNQSSRIKPSPSKIQQPLESIPKTNKSRFAESIIIKEFQKEQNSNMGIKQKKINIRESMIKEMSSSLRCNDEVGNRFAINAQNIIPLCVDEKQDINFGQSLIKFYQLGDFQ